MLCILGAGLLLTGCYRNELATIHNQIDNLNVRTMDDQIREIKASLNDLNDLKSRISPAVDDLNAAKARIEQELSALQQQAQSSEETNDKLNKEISNLQTLLANAEAAVKVLQEEDLDGRIKKIEKYVSGLASRVSALETAYESFATLDDLAKLQAAVDAIPSEFNVDFETALDKSKEHIVGWVSDGETFKSLFLDYYSKSEMNAFLELIKGKDEDQDIKIENLQATLEDLGTEIKKMVDEALVDAVKTLEENFAQSVSSLNERLDALEKVVDGIISKIGTETLEVESNIISAINFINARFGNLNDSTVAAVVAALNADIAILNAADSSIRGGADETVTLQSLDELLSDIPSSETVSELMSIASELQKKMMLCISSHDVDEALKNYLKAADAEATYALASELSTYQTTYNTLVGTDDTQPGTALYMLKAFDEVAGSGIFTGNWTKDLTAAVDLLHNLVGDRSVAERITTVAQGLVNGFVKDVLGAEGKSASDIKTLLDGFTGSVRTINGQIGSISSFKDENDSTISTALANIKSVLSALENDYAALDHGHGIDAISDLSTELTALTGVLANIKLNDIKSFADAINALVDTLDYIPTIESVRNLIINAENVLVGAMMNGEGYDGYFSTLNFAILAQDLENVKDSIADIIKADDGKLDRRIKKAFDDLNISQYVTTAFVDTAGFLTVAELDISALSALAALKVTLGDKEFAYDKIDDAVEAVLDSLNEHIKDYDDARDVFESIAARFAAIDEMIGGKDFFTTANTIASVINNIESLFGELGGKDVKGIVTELCGIHDNLVKSLLGKDGSVSDITDLNSIKSLKNHLDNIGFTDIHKDKNTSLDDVLNTLLGKIKIITDELGTGFSSDAGNTVAEKVTALQDAFNSLDSDEYDDDISELTGSLQSLLNKLSGKASGGEVSDIPNDIVSLKNDLDEIKAALDGMIVNSVTGLENILSAMDSTVSVIETSVGELAPEEGEQLTTLADEVAALKYQMANYSISDAPGLTAYLILQMGFETFETFFVYLKIGTLNNLKTKDKSNLVAAVNELFDMLTGISDVNLTALKEELAGASNTAEFEYKTIKALSEALTGLAESIGTKPVSGFTHDDVYDAIGDLEVLLGNNNTGYSDVWTAIDAIKGRLFGGLSKLLNSLTFIPDYSDGKATINCRSDKSILGELEMSFRVNASADFAKLFGTNGGKLFTISGFYRGTTSGTISGGSASLSGDILTVTFSGNDVAALKNAGDSPQVAVVITDNRRETDKETCISEYVPIYFNALDAAEEWTVTPSDGNTMTFARKAGESQTISVNSIFGSTDYSFTKNGNWFTAEKVDGGVLVKMTGNAEHSGTRGRGSVTIRCGGANYTIYIEQVNYLSNFSIASGSTLYFKKSAGTEKTVTFDVRSECTGYTVTTSGNNGNWFTVSDDEDGTLTIRMANGSNHWNGKVTVKCNDDNETFEFNVAEANYHLETVTTGSYRTPTGVSIYQNTININANYGGGDIYLKVVDDSGVQVSSATVAHSRNSFLNTVAMSNNLLYFKPGKYNGQSANTRTGTITVTVGGDISETFNVNQAVSR